MQPGERLLCQILRGAGGPHGDVAAVREFLVGAMDRSVEGIRQRGIANQLLNALRLLGQFHRIIRRQLSDEALEHRSHATAFHEVRVGTCRETESGWDGKARLGQLGESGSLPAHHLPRPAFRVLEREHIPHDVVLASTEM
jgi:hypothetical protein